MQSAALHKSAATPPAKGLAGAGAGAGAASSAAAAAAAAVEEDEVSEYTDADESMSAPTEFLAEFLSAIMGKDYPTALKYCKLILQYEPNNRTAREFYPLIVGKLVQSAIDEGKTESDEDSSSGGSGTGSLTSSGTDEDADDTSDDSSSDLSEEDDDNEEGVGDAGVVAEQQHNDNSSLEYGDTDGTTASYSSLEDEEADPVTFTSAPYNDNEDAGNGNQVAAPDATPAAPRFSDSESPTEPVSQKLIGELRGRVVHQSAPTCR